MSARPFPGALPVPPVSEFVVYLCATCGVTEPTLAVLRWHEGKRHVTDTLRLKHRRRGSDTQWSTDWSPV